MKKKILDALKAKFEGVSESILDRVATSLAKKVTSEDDVETIVGGVTFQQVLESYADSRSTEAANSAVANYEKKHNLKDGKPAEAGGPKPDPKKDDDDTPAWAKALIEQNDRLQKEVNAMKSGKVVESRRAQMDEVLKGLSASQKKAYARMNLESGTDEEFANVLEEIKGEVAAIQKETKTKGAAFGAPFNGESGPVKGEPSKEDVDAIVNSF